MKKIGIITLNGNFNCGNKLQNYALKKYIENIGENHVYTLWTNDYKNENIIKHLIKMIIRTPNYIKYNKFSKFNKLLNVKKLKYGDNYDNYVIGSDQVWNTYDVTFSYKKYFAMFSPKYKNISYAASLGTNKINGDVRLFKKGIDNIKYISVREDEGKKVICDLTKRRDVEVLIDPTMLLTKNEWDKISIKPKQYNNKKFIFNYFLGNLSDKRREEIERIAKKYDCEIVDIMDEKNPYYTCGPREFIWLEKNAFLICTDSFHSSVFAFLYNRPFIIFNREDSLENMSSRLNTLLEKFELKNRKYNNKEITKENLNHDYNEGYKILEKEREKSKEFLEKALEVK